MGRELKCPICLSLINSAVSLTCNHVFCNLCIEKSMKSASDCPVCKVPFRRREIRSAPHMDNLVSIYKSMEMASGVKIFVTQNAASTRNSGEENHDVVPICATQSNEKSHLGTDRENQKCSRRKGLKQASKTNQTASGSNLVQSSFPNSKRVQVQLHVNSDARMQPINLEGGIGEIDGNQEPKSQLSQKEIPSTRENSEPAFPPFFWLREDEDIEKSTQQTDDNQSMYTPPEVPCFSDIKDSDDDIPSQISPKRDTCVVSNNLDFIDSEIFDWTQRPCSPELYSDPLVMQTEVTAGKNGAPDKPVAALVDVAPGAMITSDIREGMFKKMETSKTSVKKGRRTKSNKRAGNATDTRQSKRTKKMACKVATVRKESQEVADQVMQKHRNLNEDPNKNKEDCYGPSVQENAAEDVVLVSDGLEPLENGNRTACETLSNTIGEKIGKSGKSIKKTFAKPLKCDGGLETYLNQEPFNQVLVSHSLTNMLPLSNDKKVLDRGMRNRTRKVNSKKISKSLKKVNSSVDGLSKDNSNKISSGPYKEILGTTDQSGMKLPAKLHIPLYLPKATVLHKCTALANEIQCAFCHSSEVSEVSGAMVHYLNGKLAADCLDARSKAIHVHRNCTEWAPNVYFEGDNVVNLELELSRSRRIKCSCCGLKGAALGCYERSCRKSFHVRCARLTPECRWDYENFVMLCPLHASCQLPKEIPESQSKQRRKSAVESKPCTHQEKTSESKNSSNSQWKCKKRCKSLVLCYSALTHIEKGIVSKFEKLSGVTILKSWDSSVTHVITSVDENRACKRTLKFLMGVLEGKWILSVHWIKACIEAGELVDEQPYEVAVDIHGIKDGPGLGRLRVQNKQPRLFDGYTFFFMGDFVPSYKVYLHDLVAAAGGKVLSRKPVAGGQKTFIVYSLELPDKCGPSSRSSVVNSRCHDAEALARSTGAVVASNSWILNSIAGHKLQDLGE